LAAAVFLRFLIRFLRFQLHVFYGGIVFLHWDQPQIWLKSGVILGALCSGATHDTVQVIKLGVQRQACKISLQQQCSPISKFSGASSSFLGLFGTRSHIFPKSNCIACGLFVTPLTHISLMLHSAPSVTQTGPQRR
jgi:hypothetical protein